MMMAPLSVSILSGRERNACAAHTFDIARLRQARARRALEAQTYRERELN